MATLIDAGAADARRSYLGGIITSVAPSALLMRLPLISEWHYNLRGAVHATYAPAAHIWVAF